MGRQSADTAPESPTGSGAARRGRYRVVSRLQGLACEALVRRRNLRLKYVELHSASAFSFLEGASRPEDLVSRAKELDLSAIALVDRDGVYGSPRLHMAAKSVGIRAHIGAEVSVEGFGNQSGLPPWMPNSVSSRPVRLSLLAESRMGYQNLCRLM